MRNTPNRQNKKDYILRGGLIGGIFFVMYFFTIHYIPEFKRFPCISSTYSFFNCLGIKLFQIIGKPAYLVITNINFLDKMSIPAQGIFSIIFLLIFYFIIGGVISYLYWKTKVRKK